MPNAVFLVLLLLIGPGYVLARYLAWWARLPAGEGGGLLGLLFMDFGPLLVGCLLLPMLACWRPPAWLIPRRLGDAGGASAEPPAPHGSRLGGLLCFLVTTLGATVAAACAGWPLLPLPMLYHDEYSYLFQAQTFLAGRLTYPPPPLPAAFDQMHVLTDGVYASRYFPGTAAWLCLFLPWTEPMVGWWLSHGLIAGFTALAGREIRPTLGWAVGLLVACSPGLLALSTMILSPTPTMVAMSVFLWSYLRSSKHRQVGWLILAGAAMGAAFLTRPVTAAGLGLPFAVDALYDAYRARSLRRLLPLAVPFVAAVMAMASYNLAVTGSAATTPYGLYTAKHTPRHVYGFHNGTRGDRARQNPEQARQIMVAYDDWADNLTIAHAYELLKTRVHRMLLANLGWVPTVPLLLVGLALAWRRGGGLLLTALGVLGLLAAYTPFAFLGIFGWGYAFEAAPWLLLLLAAGWVELVRSLAQSGQAGVAAWVTGMVLWAVATNLVGIGSFPDSITVPLYLDPGSEVVFPRRKLAERLRVEAELAAAGPILVVYDRRPQEDLHTTMVYNRPTLDGPIVRAWAQPIRGTPDYPYPGWAIADLAVHFPGRRVYVCTGERQYRLWQN